MLSMYICVIAGGWRLFKLSPPCGYTLLCWFDSRDTDILDVELLSQIDLIRNHHLTSVEFQ